MKKLFFTVCISLLALNGFSQMNTGSIFAGANSSFDLGFSTINNIDSNEKTTLLTYNLNPKIGYFIKNRLGVGGELELSSRPYISEFGNSGRISRLIVGPFVRYYVQYGSLIPFGEASVGIGYHNEIAKYFDGNSKTTHSVFSSKIGVGTDYFFNEKIALEAMVKYNYERRKPSASGATGSGHAVSGVIAFFGIVIFFESI